MTFSTTLRGTHLQPIYYQQGAPEPTLWAFQKEALYKCPLFVHRFLTFTKHVNLANVLTTRQALIVCLLVLTIHTYLTLKYKKKFHYKSDSLVVCSYYVRPM